MAEDENGVRFLVLGPLDVSGNGEAALGGPKQRAVLGMLVSRVGRVVSNDSLVDGIWGEEPPSAVQASLHSYVSNLRTAAAAAIERTGGGYRLAADPTSVDAVEFERLVDEATRALSANPERASETLRSGLGLWRGKPYADLLGVEGLQFEIRRLEELRLSAVEARIDADLALGRHQVLVGELGALATEHPLRERFQAQLMVALYRDGRQAEALRAYQRTREFLRDELGVDPSPDLQDLELRILNHDPDLLTLRDTVTEHVAFLFTDIAGSTELWEARAPAMRAALARHDEILSKAIDNAGGRPFKHTGDGVFAAFPTVATAARAAAEAQRELSAADWGDLDLRVRMAVDVGEVDARGGDYFGPTVNRGSRIVAAAHGGQILVSEAARQALAAEPGIQLRGLGEHRLRGLGAPVRVFQLIFDGASADFPELRVDVATAGPARQFGDAIRGYEVRERLAAGRVGVVYRAFQPTVGREVAVKVIRPRYANHPAFVRRFEAEARMVAGLEHPHIVSLYDYWRDADGAYLVMPLMAGGSLADKNLGALPLDRVAALVTQVGSALGYAHRQGVIHRDLKPSNILLDGDGNAYLSDFGIAVRAVERDAGIQSESAIHRAPEDRSGGAVDERSDVYSLAQVVAGLLTGSHDEFPDLSGLDPPVRSLLEASLAEDPALRPAGVDAFVGRLVALTGGMAATPEPVVTRNPYKGLAPFDVDDARDFFGRDDEIRRLVELVAASRIAVVVGPSGSGKSSLVRAGLLPALERDGIAGSDQWVTVTTVPGSHPFDELASVLGEVATESMGDMAAELAADDTGLLRVAKRIMANLEGELAIVVDQFEELYTVVTSDQVRRRFVRSLIEATGDARSRVRVILTMRADFYDAPLGDELLGPIVSEANLALAVPKPAQLREAIERPAANAGVSFEEGLTDQLLADVQEQPGSLPLMQYALTSLVSQSLDGRVSIDDYEGLGGVSGALTQRADEVYGSLDAEQQAVAEEIFLRLVTVSEDADDVRRRVRQSELESLGLEPGDVAEVLRRFGEARLLTFDRDPVTRGPTVEVAHEALLRHWDRFRGWLDARREALILHRRFRAAEAEWKGSGRDTAYLLSGGRLNQFEVWASGSNVVLTTDEAEFLERSVAARDAADVRRRRLRRGVVGGFGVAALIALVLAVTALVQRNEARDATEVAEARGNEAREAAAVAEARELVAQAENTLGSDPELAIHLGLAGLSTLREAGEDPAQAVSLLHSAIAADRVVQRVPGSTFAAMSPDGALLATADVEVERGVAVIDLGTGAVIERYVPDRGTPGAATFGPDGKLLAVDTADGGPAVTVWNRETDEAITLGGTAAIVEGLGFTPDGELFAFYTGETIEVWTSAGQRVYRERADGTPDFSRTGLIAYPVALDGNEAVIEIRIVDPASWGVVDSVMVEVDEDSGFLYTSWSPDGTRLAVSDQTQIVILDVADGTEVARTDRFDSLHHAEWLHGGDAFFVGGESVQRVFDAATGEVRIELLGRGAGIRTAEYDLVHGTDRVAVAATSQGEGSDATAVIFDVSPIGGYEIAGWTAPIDVDNGRHGTGFSADGNVVLGGDMFYGFVVTANIDGSGARILGGGSGWFPTLNATGTFFTYADPSGDWVVRATDTGDVVYQAPAGWDVTGVSQDGSQVVIVHTGEGNCFASELDSGAVEPAPSRLVSTTGAVEPVDLVIPCMARTHFSHDGSLMYGAQRFENHIAAVFDTTTGEIVGDLRDNGFADGGFGAAFSPDDRELVTGQAEVPIYELETLLSDAPIEAAVRRVLTGHKSLTISIAMSPVGNTVATSGRGDVLKQWDVDTGRLLAEFGGIPEEERFHIGDFHPTEPWLLVVSPPNEVRIYTLDTDELVSIAESRLSRSMTEQECEQYFRASCEDAGV